MRSSLLSGFSIVVGYIFNENTKRQSIAMNAPVVPTTEYNTQTISFDMLQSYTLETLPTLNDPRVKLS